jgi:hypothetical protein
VKILTDINWRTASQPTRIERAQKGNKFRVAASADSFYC